jgi:hypothetical protein
MSASGMQGGEPRFAAGLGSRQLHRYQRNCRSDGFGLQR